jgi:hypothetical protein
MIKRRLRAPFAFGQAVAGTCGILTMHIDGQCHCGRVTYQADIDPERVSICHCTDCQTLTGSPYRVTVILLRQEYPDDRCAAQDLREGRRQRPHPRPAFLPGLRLAAVHQRRRGKRPATGAFAGAASASATG